MFMELPAGAYTTAPGTTTSSAASTAEIRRGGTDRLRIVDLWPAVSWPVVIVIPVIVIVLPVLFVMLSHRLSGLVSVVGPNVNDGVTVSCCAMEMPVDKKRLHINAAVKYLFLNLIFI